LYFPPKAVVLPEPKNPPVNINLTGFSGDNLLAVVIWLPPGRFTFRGMFHLEPAFAAIF
jgi:hypothetical protein